MGLRWASRRSGGGTVGSGSDSTSLEADGGFEHQHDVEALFTDVLDDAGDVLGLGDGLVNGFAEFLDEVFDLLIDVLAQ